MLASLPFAEEFSLLRMGHSSLIIFKSISSLLGNCIISRL